jgi:hypothetical protein
MRRKKFSNFGLELIAITGHLMVYFFIYLNFGEVCFEVLIKNWDR